MCCSQRLFSLSQRWMMSLAARFNDCLLAEWCLWRIFVGIRAGIDEWMAMTSTKEAGSRVKTMTGNDHVQTLPSSSPAGLLPLLVVFGSVLIGPWSPIAAAQMGPDRKEKAVLDIVVLQRRNGTLVLSDTVQLTGVFSSAGTIEYAKGYLRQVSWSFLVYLFEIYCFMMQKFCGHNDHW